MCAPLTEDRCKELELDMQVADNTSLLGTPFTVSIDLLGEGCTTGVSAHDRAATIRALVDPKTKPSDLGRPGHIFPLRARNRGVLRRPGHTEAVVDLTRMAGLQTGGALIEIMNEDGSMARLPDLVKIAKRFDLKIISIAKIIEYRLRSESIVERGETVDLPTQWGHFKLIPFRQKKQRFGTCSFGQRRMGRGRTCFGSCSLFVRYRGYFRFISLRLRQPATRSNAYDRERG